MRRLPRSFVYLILSERGEVYLGSTTCIKRRLAEHNSPGNRGWTRGRRWHLLAVRMYLDRASAVRSERQLKRSKYDKRNWLARLDRLDLLRRRHGIPERLSR